MKKEELEKIGLTDEQINVVIEGFKGYIKKEKFDEVISQKEKLEVDFLALQEDSKVKEEGFKKDFNKLKIDNAIEISVNKANGKNIKAIRALIDLENISVDENGLVNGVDNQIENLVKGADSSFLFGENTNVVKGATLKISNDKVNSTLTKSEFQKMNYKERLDLYLSNKDLHDSLSDNNTNIE